MTKILFGGLFVYFAVLAILWAMRTGLIYPLDPTHDVPDLAKLPNVSERTLKTDDDQAIVIWAAPPQSGRPTVLYFTGNAGNLADRTERFRRFLLQGYGLAAMAYRGANGSTGRPGEEAIMADAGQLRRQLPAVLGARPSGPIVFYGESLGAAVAVRLAESHPPDGVILEAPFTSVPDVAAAALPIFPARLLLDQLWETEEHIRGMTAPLLVIHGTNDRVVPFTHGNAVFEAAGSVQKSFARVEDGTHHNLWTVEVQKEIFDFMNSL